MCNLMWTFTLKLSLWGLSALLTWCSIFSFYCWIVNDIQKLKTMWSALLYFATYTQTERPQSLESQCAIVTQIPIGPWILYHSWCVFIQLHIGGKHWYVTTHIWNPFFCVLAQTVWPAQSFVTNLASQGK